MTVSVTADRLGDTAYEMAGEGPKVVLVHGLGMNRAMWDWQWPALTGRFNVLRYDLLGHGESAKPRDPYSLPRFAKQIHDLLDQLRWNSVALVGFSLGGMIVRAFALAYPERTRALAILNSAHDRTEAERDAVRKRVAEAAEGGPGATIEGALARWFTADFAAAHPEVLERVRDWIMLNEKDVYPLSYSVLAEGDIELAKRLGEIRCPALVMTGEEDRGNTPDMSRRMAAQLPNAELEILSGLRHMGLAESPKAFNPRLLDFLTRTSGP